MVERNETTIVAAAPEKTEIENALALVIDNVVSDHEAAPTSTPMPNPASTTASQDIPATPTSTKTLLLLTSSPKFNRIATLVGSESAKSSVGNTEKIPSREPPTAYVLPNDIDIQLDLVLANQHLIMANQHEL